MKNFRNYGKNLTVPAPADVTSGQVVFVGTIFGIASIDAALGTPLVMHTGGVFDLPKIAAEAIGVGDPVYYDASAELVTGDDDTGNNSQIGVAVEVAANPSAIATVRLNSNF